MFFVKSELFRHHLLCAIRNDERLRHRAERRKCERLSKPRESAGSEVNINVLAGDDGFFCRANFAGEQVAQPFYKGWYLDAQKAVVISIAQVGLRKAGGDDQRNSLCFQAGHRLFAARSCAEIKSADHHVSWACPERKLRIV